MHTCRDDAQVALWTPVTRTDVAWDFGLYADPCQPTPGPPKSQFSSPRVRCRTALFVDDLFSCPLMPEKFLLDSSGTPVKRYSRYYPMLDIATDIEPLI